MMPALTSGDDCHGHLASVTGALRSRTFTHRLPRSGLVYWRKIIAGRALIAARIYRGFWTNGNGFLRGIRIRILSRDVCICARFREKQHRKIILEGFGSVFTPRQAGNTAAAPRFLAFWQAQKYAGSASLAQASRPGPARGNWVNVSSAMPISVPRFESLGGKRKGRPEGRPSCSGCRNGGQ
ncbi:hypothetical protein E0H44_20175 [Rhizobium leguminosarum bv. viciae]|nr:hypothetical protein E0H44_20175 [Rhizobium leguminosarum bv. viciae]